MDFVKALADEKPDHIRGMADRLLRAELLPGVRAKMVATEQDALPRKVGSRSNLLHALPKVRGRHSGVAAELIDLIAGSFDQQRAIAHERVPHGGFNDPRMRRTHRVDPTAFFAGAGRSKFL
jgi:hypothetical protein